MISETYRNLSLWQKFGVVLGVVATFVVICLCAFRLFFVSFVDNYELGFVYNKFNGKIEILSHTGWIVVNPLRDEVHSIDLRPGQVCMNANSRVLNCKLVRFNPKGLPTFLEWHGRQAGQSTMHDGTSIYEILKSYAFNVKGGADCPFLIIEDEMRK